MLENIYSNASELHCAPHTYKYAEKNSSCFTHSELRLIASEFNKKKHPSIPKIKAKTKKELTEKLIEAYKHICDKHQFCWIRQTLTEPEKIKRLESAFRPKKPESWDRDHNTWLNTYDILNVMQQYDKLYKDFSFLGVYPIDFAEKNSSGYCIGELMCDFDIHKNMLEQKKKRFGIVFNTDKSTGPGQHWISLYCDLNPKRNNYGIYYYDSVANPTPPQVVRFMKKIAEQVNDPKFEVKHNKIQRQFSNYDCGVFSCVILTQCLKDIPFDHICKRMHTDKEINRLRDVLYRPNLRPHTA